MTLFNLLYSNGAIDPRSNIWESVYFDRLSILTLINALNVNKAYGADQISVQMIKLCGNSILLPLQIIFTNIIAKGIFPDQWKMTNVTPVHKKEKKQIIKNYS